MHKYTPAKKGREEKKLMETALVARRPKRNCFEPL